MHTLKPIPHDDLVFLVETWAPLFPDGFSHWVLDNSHVWDKYLEIVDEILSAGIRHYSSNTIFCVLRHHTALAEVSQGDIDVSETDVRPALKLNSKHTPYMSRLFAFAYPEFAELFEYRKTYLERSEEGKECIEEGVPFIVQGSDDEPSEVVQ